MTPAVPELVIFDHDGVLVDSEIIAMELLSIMATDHGRPTSTDEAFDRYLGTSFDFVMDDLRSTGAAIDRDALYDSFHADLFEGFRTRLQPVPGIPELLGALVAAGRPLAIASSGSRDRVHLGTSSTAIDLFFRGSPVITANDVERGKPFPDLFLAAAERAGIAPDRCLVIEDSPFGVEAAHRAGMTAVGLAHRTPAENLHEADHVVTSVAEIWPLVGLSDVVAAE